MSFICDICNYEFMGECNLKRHIKQVHDKIKNFQCVQCDYKCSEKSDLTKHIKRIHDKIKDFKCVMCDSKFSHGSHLKIHIKAIHDKIKDIKCLKCEFVCCSNGDLKRHVKSIHDNPKPKNMSRGAHKINEYLKQLNITFKREAIFEDLKGINEGYLRYDFMIEKDDKKIFIEFDGQQHYQPVKFCGISAEKALENYKITRTHDRIKNDYCKDNSFEILRIKYDQIDISNEMIDAFLKLHLA